MPAMDDENHLDSGVTLRGDSIPPVLVTAAGKVNVI